MENKNGICIWGGVIRKVKEIAEVIIFCALMSLLCMLFVFIGIVWLLADRTVRELEKDGFYEEKTKKATSCQKNM